MTLYDLFVVLNDNTTIQLYDCETYNLIDTYDGKEDVPPEYEDCEITDIFVDTDTRLKEFTYAVICVEIETLFVHITYDEAVERWAQNKSVLLMYDDGTEAYAESIDDIELHTGGYAYEKGEE